MYLLHTPVTTWHAATWAWCKIIHAVCFPMTGDANICTGKFSEKKKGLQCSGQQCAIKSEIWVWQRVILNTPHIKSCSRIRMLMWLTMNWTCFRAENRIHDTWVKRTKMSSFTTETHTTPPPHPPVRAISPQRRLPPPLPTPFSLTLLKNWGLVHC